MPFAVGVNVVKGDADPTGIPLYAAGVLNGMLVGTTSAFSGGTVSTFVLHPVRKVLATFS